MGIKLNKKNPIIKDLYTKKFKPKNKGIKIKAIGINGLKISSKVKAFVIQ